jgi:hypothetical protein
VMAVAHDLEAARKNARTDEDAAAVAWAEDEIERLQELLNDRDEYIVGKGLWHDFLDTIPIEIAEETSSDAALIRDLNTLAAAHASGPNDDGHVIAQAAAKIVELRMQSDKMLRDEREACAAVAEKFFQPEMDYKWDEAGRAIALAIRDRTQR